MRHGETSWNAEGRYQGKLDSPLTARGIKQAEACGRKLAASACNIHTFASSPLGRTRQTSDIIRAFADYPEPIWDSRLAEVSLGSWDGLTDIDIDEMWPGKRDDAGPFDWYFRSPDGESFEAVCDRARDWLGRLDGRTIAVSHGLIGRIIRGVYLGLNREEMLSLPVPQNAIWHLANGQIVAIETEAFV